MAVGARNEISVTRRRSRRVILVVTWLPPITKILAMTHDHFRPSPIVTICRRFRATSTLSAIRTACLLSLCVTAAACEGKRKSSLPTVSSFHVKYEEVWGSPRVMYELEHGFPPGKKICITNQNSDALMDVTLKVHRRYAGRGYSISTLHVPLWGRNETITIDKGPSTQVSVRGHALLDGTRVNIRVAIPADLSPDM